MRNRLKLSSASLLLANLAPLAGVLFLGWSVSSVIVLYWFENVVIGVINVARMAMFSPGRDSLVLSLGARGEQAAAASRALEQFNVGPMVHAFKFFLIPFFILHYFMFCAGHGVFVFSMFPDQQGFFADDVGVSLFGSLGRAIEIFSTPLALAAAALALSHLVSFFVNFIGGAEYRKLDIRKLMVMPYGRIIALHITIIFGGFAAMALDGPIWVLVILIAVKVGVDLKMHLSEHNQVSRAGRAD